MCAKELILSLSIALNLAQSQLLLPPPDGEGRRRNLNEFGFTDTILNRTQLDFLWRGMEVAKPVPLSKTERVRQPMMMEIGPGLGDLAEHAVKLGIRYAAVDREKKHIKLINERLEAWKRFDSQYTAFVGKFPYFPKVSKALHDELEQLKWVNNVNTIGTFSMLMYLSGEEQVRFFKWAYDYLPPGGRMYITGISAFNNVFKLYSDDTYIHKREKFLASGGKEEPFPGWIPDVTVPEMQPYLPENYLKMYPPYFHLLDPVVLEHYAKQAGFIKLEAGFHPRKFPGRLRYRGKVPDVGEIAYIVLEKPE